MEKVFVTGTNGLLGTNLVMELLEQGFYVKGLVRNPATYQGIKHPHFELITGKLNDDLKPHLEGCQYLIHAAAETRPELKRYEEYMHTNVQHTIQLLEASINADLKKFIFVSSAVTIGFADKNAPGHEDNPIRFPNTQSLYALSKVEAEEKIMDYKEQIDIVIANPTFMIGPYDTKPSSGKIILMGLDKRIVFHPPGGKNFVYVKDVARGIIKCIRTGVNGEKYLLAGHNLTYREFFKIMVRQSGNKALLIKIPSSILILIGYFGSLFRAVG